IAGPPAAVHDNAQLAGAAVGAHAARVETHAPFVEELAEREAVAPVGLDVDQSARAVRVERRVRNLAEEALTGSAVAARAEAGRTRSSVGRLGHTHAGRNLDLAPVDDEVEVHVVVADHAAEQRRQAGVGDLAQGVYGQPPW